MRYTSGRNHIYVHYFLFVFLQESIKMSFSHGQLLVHCIQVLDSYNCDIQSVEEHVNKYLKNNQVRNSVSSHNELVRLKVKWYITVSLRLSNLIVLSVLKIWWYFCLCCRSMMTAIRLSLWKFSQSVFVMPTWCRLFLMDFMQRMERKHFAQNKTFIQVSCRGWTRLSPSRVGKLNF